MLKEIETIEALAYFYAAEGKLDLYKWQKQKTDAENEIRTSKRSKKAAGTTKKVLAKISPILVIAALLLGIAMDIQLCWNGVIPNTAESLIPWFGIVGYLLSFVFDILLFPLITVVNCVVILRMINTGATRKVASAERKLTIAKAKLEEAEKELPSSELEADEFYQFKSIAKAQS